jgi:hypothetical protein
MAVFYHFQALEAHIDVAEAESFARQFVYPYARDVIGLLP